MFSVRAYWNSTGEREHALRDRRPDGHRDERDGVVLAVVRLPLPPDADDCRRAIHRQIRDYLRRQDPSCPNLTVPFFSDVIQGVEAKFMSTGLPALPSVCINRHLSAQCVVQ